MKHTGWSTLLLLVLPALACQPAGEPAETTTTEAAAATPTVRWNCRNDVEISCTAAQCEVGDSFTPMDVQVDDAGSMSVCAYSGCWEGTGTVAKSEAFVVVTGHDLPFSTAPDSEDSKADIVIAIDRQDQVAILKAGSFAHPLRCEMHAPMDP